MDLKSVNLFPNQNMNSSNDNLVEWAEPVWVEWRHQWSCRQGGPGLTHHHHHHHHWIYHPP